MNNITIREYILFANRDTTTEVDYK